MSGHWFMESRGTLLSIRPVGPLNQDVLWSWRHRFRPAHSPSPGVSGGVGLPVYMHNPTWSSERWGSGGATPRYTNAYLAPLNLGSRKSKELNNNVTLFIRGILNFGRVYIAPSNWLAQKQRREGALSRRLRATITQRQGKIVAE